jgi:hypothetical protein
VKSASYPGGLTPIFLPAFIAGLAAMRYDRAVVTLCDSAGFMEDWVAGLKLAVSVVARIAFFTADRWLINDFF